MFKHIYVLVIEASNAVEIANKLSEHHIWFNISDAYINYKEDPERKWIREVAIKVSNRQLKKINEEAKDLILGYQFVS